LQDDIPVQKGQLPLDQESEGDTYVMKKVDAWGKFLARILGIEVGSWIKPCNEAAIPDERVTIKKEC